MSIAHLTSPAITIYKIDTTTDTFTKLANSNTLPSANGYGTSFSPDGRYMSVAQSDYPYITIYRATGGLSETNLRVTNGTVTTTNLVVESVIRTSVIETLGDDLQLNGKLATNSTIQVGTFAAATATTVCRTTTGVLAACSSSSIYKKDITNLDVGGLDTIMQLQARQFAWKDSGVQDFGFIAEEVAAVNPLFGQYESDGTLSGVKYTQMTALLTQGVQELNVKVNAINDRLSVVEQGTFNKLTVATDVTVKGNIFLEGKLISVGQAPEIQLISITTNQPITDPALSATITGTDVTGIINLITQNYTGDPYRLKIIFSNGYTYTPVVVLSPNGRDGALLGSYIEDTTLTDAYVNFVTTPEAGKGYRFNYKILSYDQQ
jgi:hypothetical protein